MNYLLKTLLFLTLAYMICCTACNKEVFDATTDNGQPQDSSSIENLNVPDGFNYSTSQEISFQLKTVDAKEDAVSNVLIYLYGVDQNNKTDQLHVGLSNSKGQFDTQVYFANHFKEVMIRTVNNYKEVDTRSALQKNINMQLVVE